MKKKNYLFSVLTVVLVALTCIGMAACGGGGSDSSGDNDDVVTAPPTPPAKFNLENLLGVWAGDNADHSLRIALGIYPNNTMQISAFQKTSSKYESFINEEGSYVFNTATGELTITYFDDNTTETFRIENQNSSGFTFYVNDNAFYMSRYTGSGDGSEAGDGDGSGDGNGDGNGGGPGVTDWAPSYVNGKHFTLTSSSSPHNIYFTTNTTINPASNAGSIIINGATYERTNVNEARITITTSYTYTAYLTFTSSTGGTFRWSTGLTGTFTVTDEEPSSTFSAPSSIAFKTFTILPGSVAEQSILFGSQSGSNVRVNNSTNWESTSLYNVYYTVTYYVTSNKSATLEIEMKYVSKSTIASTTFTRTWTYELTFTSATGGNYSRSLVSTNHYDNINNKTTTGTFTLK